MTTNSPPDWSVFEARCADLKRRAAATSGDVSLIAQAAALRDEIRTATVAAGEAASDGNGALSLERRAGPVIDVALLAKAEAVRRHLILDSVPVPDAAPRKIAEIAEALQGRVISPVLFQETQAKLAEFRRESTTVRDDVRRREEEIAALRRTHELLAAHSELLDALQGRDTLE